MKRIRKGTVVQASASALCLGLSWLAVAQSEKPIAIVGAWVVDGTGSPAIQSNVIIRGERIEAVGPDARPVEGAVVIDATGSTLIPALSDLHTHATYSAGRGASGDWIKNLKAYIYSGVANIVDFGTYPEAFAPMRALASASGATPHLFLAARISTPLGHGTEGGRQGMTAEVQTPGEARAAMRKILPFGPDTIKVFTDGWRYGSAPDMTSMTEPTLQAIVDEAHRHNVEVLSHTVTIDKGKIAARAGVDCIDHSVSDREVDQELISMMKERGTCYTPTMVVYENRALALDHPFLVDVLEPVVRQSFSTSGPGNAAEPPTEISPARRRRWANIVRNVALLHRAGVPIAAGTDAGVTGTFHGWATLRELELLVEAGLSPVEAIKAATFNACQALRVDVDRGTIAPGKRADLVLVAGEPHRKMSDIWKIKEVFLSGARVDRERLRQDIQTSEVTPQRSIAPSKMIDDFEDLELPLWSAFFEAGHDHSAILYSTTLRSSKDHALTVLAQMSQRGKPSVQLQRRLSPGGFSWVDASSLSGIRFEARGDGPYRLLLETHRVRQGDHFAASFEAGADWSVISIPFSSLTQSGRGKAALWTGRDLQAIRWEISRPAGTKAWLEIDNVSFY